MTRAVLRALERELLVFARTWRGSAFSAFVQPILFLAAMGLGLGGLVDEGVGAGGQLDYLEFVAPGLLAAHALMATAGEALWGVMGGVKWMGQFSGMVATPMTPGDVYGGLVLSAGVRAGLAAVAFLVVAAVLGGVASLWAPLAVVAAVLLAMVTTAGLAAWSVRRQDDLTFSLIMRLGVIPLFLFSGTFFPVEQLPDVLEPVVVLSPLWHGVEVARDATTGAIDGWTAVHAAVLVALVLVVLPIGMRGFERRLTP
ncbi:MAG TPA: ABC transporter permease [Acidimicrobiales bacterium]|nr:ABC transporter permease [Acidimicrobiales bacterium]